MVLLGGRLGRGLYAVDENLGQSRTSAAIQFCEMEESLTSRVSCDRPPLSSDPFNFATAVSSLPVSLSVGVKSIYQTDMQLIATHGQLQAQKILNSTH